MKNQDPQHVPENDSKQQSHKTGFGVAASPFNTVKLELGFVIIIGIVLWLGIDIITSSIGKQLLLLAGYGIVSALWLIFRTSRILKQQHPGHNG